MKKTYKAKIKDILHPNEEVMLLKIKTDPSFSFVAGQFITITFENMPPRIYSIAGEYTENGEHHIELHIGHSGGVVSTYIAQHLKINDSITHSEANGENIYRKDHAGYFTAIASGLGITPIKAMIEKAEQDNFPFPFTLHWETGELSQRYLEDYFKNMAAQYENFHYFAHHNAEMRDCFMKDNQDFTSHHFYLAGSRSMIADMIPILLDKKVKKENIGFDQPIKLDML